MRGSIYIRNISRPSQLLGGVWMSATAASNHLCSASQTSGRGKLGVQTLEGSLQTTPDSGSLGLFIGAHTMRLKMRKDPALNTDIS